MKRTPFILTSLLLVPLALLHAAEPVPPRGFRAIFNGRDLTGWYGLNPHSVAKLQGEKREANLKKQREEFAKHWRVENGELVNVGTGPYATTEEEFGDIEFRIEYKTVAKADSGIYLRSTPQVQIWDKNQVFDPKKPDRRPHLGSGGLFNNTPDAPGRDPLVLADKPFGEWNAFRIRQVGVRTWVWLNDKLVVDNAVMENYWDRAKPLPAKGPIMLQTHGGEIRWRNLFVRDIPRAADAQTQLIASIEKVVLRRGRDGSGPTWFHPRACIVPGASGSVAFMTLQTITGSDYFGPVHWMASQDLGRTWTEPQPVPALGRVKQPDGVEEGVCDVVPEWHPQTKTVLALGHNVFYSGPKFSRDQPPRWPVYAVWKDGKWGARRKLEWNDPRGAYIYSNNCGQRVLLPNGDILLAFTHGPVKTKPRSVSSVICSFDGETLSVKRVGDEITHDKGRGLLEPSLTQFGGRFLLTLRAEDDRGYVSASEDGLKWTPKQPWSWDDGETLAMSTTQQHWLAHSEALWLVYTRKDASNANVIRWRSPLWMAQVDTRTLRLRRGTERVVLPLVGDGVKDPNRVAIMGNFHPVNVSPDESWVTVGEWQPKNGIKGDLLLARIRWSKPNKLAP